MKTWAYIPSLSSERAGSPGRKYGWHSSPSTAVVVVQTQVVKHADEAANAHQIFIRPGKAVLVREDEIEGAEAITFHHRSLLSLSLLLLSLPMLKKVRGSLETMEKEKSILVNSICDAKIEPFGF